MSSSEPVPGVREQKAVQVHRRLRVEEIDALVARYKAGASLREAAEPFGIHPDTAGKHLERRGIPRRKLASMNQEQIARARELHSTGWSFIAIGRELGFSPNTVKKAVRSQN